MAKSILLNCQITLAGVDISDHCSSVTVEYKRAGVDSTNFSGGGKEQMAGLKSDSFTLDVQQDFAAAQVNSILEPLYQAGSEFQVVVIPAGGAVSATNPSFSGTCILLDYQPLTGKVGDLSSTKVTLPTQRTGITMATS